MSTVIEVIAANHAGMKVLGLSAIANAATGGPDQEPDTIEAVVAMAAICGVKIETILRELFPKLPRPEARTMTAIPAVAKLLDLTGRVAIVTGASGGIGAGIARRFGEAGANVVCHYNGNKDAAEKVVAAIKDAGGKAVAIQADISTGVRRGKARLRRDRCIRRPRHPGQQCRLAAREAARRCQRGRLERR